MVSRAGHGANVLVLTGLSEGVAKLVGFLGEMKYFREPLLGEAVQVQSIEALLSSGGLDVLLQEVRRTVVEHGLELVVLDSLTDLFTLYEEPTAVRPFLPALGSALFMLGCTVVGVQGQYNSEQSLPEQVIAHTVILLNISVGGSREERELGVSKMRGSSHLRGLQPYELTQVGLSLLPAGKSEQLEGQRVRGV